MKELSFLLQSVQLVQTLHVSNLALRRSGVPLRLRLRCSPALYTGPEHDAARDQLPAFAHHKGGSEVEEGRPLLVLRDADVAVLVRWDWMNGGRFGGYAYQNLRKWPFAVIVNQVMMCCLLAGAFFYTNKNSLCSKTCGIGKIFKYK